MRYPGQPDTFFLFLADQHDEITLKVAIFGIHATLSGYWSLTI